MERPFRIGSMAGFAVIAAASAAQANSIGIQFWGAPDGAGVGTKLPASQAAGVVSQINWNDDTTTGNGAGANATYSTIVDNNSATTGMTAVIYAANGSNSGTNGSSYTDTGAQDLFSGFMSDNTASGGPDEVSLLSIPSSYVASGYNLYVYAERSGQQTDTIGINSTGVDGAYSSSVSYTNIQAGTTYTPSGGTTLTPGNYVEFTGLSTSNLYVFADPVGSATGYLSGVQIVQAPEPASLTLAGAVIGMLCLRRRRASIPTLL